MKDKMRCPRCGKTFRPAKSSQTLCDQCEKQDRIARAAVKAGGGATVARPSAQPTPQVKIVGPGANMLDPTAARASTEAPPPDTGLFGSAAIREEQRRAQQRRDEQRRAEERARELERHRDEQRRPHDYIPTHPPKRLPQRPPRAERPTSPPRPPKPQRVAAPRFELTDEMRAKIEARYLELAQPIEFDGIRTRIATELEIPKSHVKRVVADLRARMQLPSWWELQSYSGEETDLERIRMAYLPHLPVPEVGIHKTLAESLDLDPRTVYQGIRRIRAEMRLPQYNAPELHHDEAASAPETQAPSAQAEPSQPSSQDISPMISAADDEAGAGGGDAPRQS